MHLILLLISLIHIVLGRIEPIDDPSSVPLNEWCSNSRLNDILRTPVSVKSEQFERDIKPCLTVHDIQDLVLGKISTIYYVGQDVPFYLRDPGVQSNRPAILNPGAHFGLRYKFVRELGEGGHGVVYEAIDVKNEMQRVAIKVLDREHQQSGMLEAELVSKVISNNQNDEGSRYITQVLGQFGTHYGWMVVYPLRDGDLIDLTHRIHANRQWWDLEQVQHFLTTLLKAIRCLADNDIVHCDIKPDNILYYARQSSTNSADLAQTSCQIAFELTDFGWANKNEVGGTHGYIPPEHYSHDLFRSKYCLSRRSLPRQPHNDVFALAWTMVRVLTAGHIHESSLIFQHHTTRDQVRMFLDHNLRKAGTRFLKGMSVDKFRQFVDFLSGCLDPRPQMRYSPREALRHPFLQTNEALEVEQTGRAERMERARRAQSGSWDDEYIEVERAGLSDKQREQVIPESSRSSMWCCSPQNIGVLFEGLRLPLQ